MAGGRRRRRCHYKNCDHHEAQREVDKVHVKKCTFRPVPKDPVRANLWLNLGAITHLTPKRLTAFNCFICSCHFSSGSELPDEYIEEYDGAPVEDMPMHNSNPNVKRSFPKGGDQSASNSPLAKTNRVDVLTPRTKLAVDALLFLPGNAEQHSCQEITTPKSSVKYSPRNQLWIARGSSVRKKARRILQDMVESSKSQVEVTGCSGLSQQSFVFEDCDDLGVMPLHMCSTPLSKKSVAETENQTPFTMSKSRLHQRVVDCNNNLSSGFEGDSGICNSHSAPETEAKYYRNQEIQCDRSLLCYHKAREQLSWDEFKFYTGLTKTMFEVLYSFLGGDAICGKLKYKYGDKTPVREQFIGDLLPRDKLFMTLLRLRRGIPLRDLGTLFKVTEGWASRIVFAWVRFMSMQFKLLESRMFPTADAQNSLKAKCYEKFPRLRGIIDCSEFRIQRPKHLQQQSNTYSTYKSANTIKFLICISCYGGLSFISEAAEGSISDRKLLVDSGILDRMLPQEALMADRGFDAEDLFDERDLELIMPAFLGHRSHFTARELIISRAIAVSRIHVETFIGMIKQFRLVRYVIPNKMLPIASDLVKVCAFLANFQLPFIKDDTEDNN